jgi:hypothetical protein
MRQNMMVYEYLVAQVPKGMMAYGVTDAIMRTYPEKYTHCEHSEMNKDRIIEIRAYLKLKKDPLS